VNETDKGKLARLYIQFALYGCDTLTHDEIDWLFRLAKRLHERVDFLNNELPLVKHRLVAQTDQVYRG
jgi:hypothetical protein